MHDACDSCDDQSIVRELSQSFRFVVVILVLDVQESSSSAAFYVIKIMKRYSRCCVFIIHLISERSSNVFAPHKTNHSQ